MGKHKTFNHGEFQVKLFDEVLSLVGCNVSQREEGISINQLVHVKHVLQDYGFYRYDVVSSTFPVSGDVHTIYEMWAGLN